MPGKIPPKGGDNIVNLEEIRKQVEANEQDLDYTLFSDDAALQRMNEAHAFIHSYGGKPVVTSHIYNETTGREELEFSTPDAIQTRYSNQTILVDRNKVEMGKWWIRHAGRREYQTVIFDPSKPKEYKNCLNLWEGMSVQPQKGSWKHTRKHIYKILCNKDKTKFKYFMKWLAWCIQNPAKPAEVACVFKGKEGAGKGFIFTQLVEMFGLHGLPLSDRKLLTGLHNGHLQRIVFLFADEAYYPGDKEAEGVLKQLITQHTITYRSMYKDAVMGANRLHIGMSTNNDWVIPAGDDARRYFINEVDNRYAKGKSTELVRNLYFSNLWGEMKNGGQAAMLYDLQKIKLHGWHPRYDVPETSEMDKQKLMNLSVLEASIFSILEDGQFPGDFDKEREFYHISAQEIYEYIEKIEPTTKRFSSVKKAEILKTLGVYKYRKKDKVYWVFPTLREMRLKWNEAYLYKQWSLDEQWYIPHKPF